MIVLYGIKHCDTVKRARRWLDDHGITHRFHDFRVDGLDQNLLVSWSKHVGWETLLNRRSTTWRQLPAAQRDKITSAASAITAMLANPSLIKRPVLDCEGDLCIGFVADEYATLISNK